MVDITLEEVKAFCRIDADYSGDDMILELIRDSAVEKLEGYSNLWFWQRENIVEFAGHYIELPYGPTGTITSVVKQVTPPETLTTDQYSLDGVAFKTLIIGSDSSVTWWNPIIGTPYPYVYPTRCDAKYIVTYETGYEVLPASLKHAVLIQVDYMYKNQGTADAANVTTLAAQLCNRYSRNLAI